MHGRLGNQFFQYAYARNLAKIRKDTITIDFSNIDKRALSEIQVNISTYMIAAKKEYARLGRKSS